jgi:hypothetical protein
MPSDRDGRPDDRNGAQNIDAIQNQHRGQHNKPARVSARG